MKSVEKKDAELKSTLARLRLRNQQNHATHSAVTQDEQVTTQSNRQRVSPKQTKVSTLDRQAVLHAVIRDLLSGKITQGQALKKLRVDVLGLRQDEYATLVGVSRKTVSDVENDKGNYSAEIVNKIYKPFGLQIGLVPISKSLLTSLLAN